jgi:deoxyribodipyrimidine photo-lyase
LFWNVSEQGALDRLAIFIRDHLQGYQSGRDFPSLDQTSKLSAYLHWGQISVRTVWHAIWNACRQDQSLQADSMFFIRELCWREFSYNLLYHFPLLPDKNFHDKFDRFPWRYNEQFLKAWQEGKTGYPFVDAGMRELLQTGYMHNRVRMIVASFLIKNLLLDWRHGRDWFWQHLVDADVANNSMSWQWVAGCGVDAAPYFRIFNPTTQGEKFDKQGDYIRKFLPELARLPDKYLFEPHKAPALMLYQAGITLGKTYPYPIVELDVSRKIALQLYHNM